MENNAEPLRLLVTTLIIDYLAVTSEEMQVSPVFPPLPSYVFLISANHRIFCMHTRFRSTSPPPRGSSSPGPILAGGNPSGPSTLRGGVC